MNPQKVATKTNHCVGCGITSDEPDSFEFYVDTLSPDAVCRKCMWCGDKDYRVVINKHTDELRERWLSGN